MLRFVLVTIVITALTTVVGVVALWPSGEGRQTAIENADEMGLVTERLRATVDETTDRRCSYASDDDPEECRIVTLTVHEGTPSTATSRCSSGADSSPGSMPTGTTLTTS